MLSYALAIAVALSSLVLFLTAFFMSDIHRKDDFLWSAVGLFYALVLWFCARNITGAVLLGQASASVLLISFVWQTLKLRKAVANPERAIAISNFSVLQGVNGLLKSKKKKPLAAINTPVAESPDLVTESEISIPKTTSTDNKISNEKKAKGRSFGKFFGGKKKNTITNTKLDEVLDNDLEETKSKSPLKAENKISATPQVVNKGSVSEEKDKPEILKEQQEIKETKPEEIVDTVDEKPVEEELIADVPEVKKEEITSGKNVDTEIQMEDLGAEETPVTVEPEITPKTETPVKTENAVENILEQETNSSSAESNPEEKEPATTIVEEKLVAERATTTSSLDSLETVEVAEVLEALPENSSGEKNNNSNNIIEVTSTEIESQQSDDNSKPE